MAKQKLTEREMNFEFAKTSLRWRNVTKMAGILIRSGLALGIGYFLFEAVKVFAGQETDANIVLDLILRMSFDKWIGVIFGFGGLILAAVKNKQLKNTRKAHSEHIRTLEKLIDSGRQRSRLNQYGETHDDDK